MNVLITIFTPTYNRSELLINLYTSLQTQTCKFFEWVIVDDGSIDDTHKIVKGFIEQNNDFKITYVKQENQGKHIAINRGVNFASGELFFIVDSDDILTSGSIQLIMQKYEIVKDNSLIAGVVGRKAYFNGDLIGSDINYDDLICSSIDFRYKYNIHGDMAEVFKTSIFKKFPFPKYENERFCPESLIYNRIAKDYNMLWFSKKVYLAEYLPDGLTYKVVKIRMTSPIATMITYAELSKLKIPFLQKIKANINFWRFSFNSDYGLIKKSKFVSFTQSIIGYPLGYILYTNDKIKNK
jgi:glycosyltransferase involved in cell wall biosynthesis